MLLCYNEPSTYQPITDNYQLCYYDIKYGKQPSSILTSATSEQLANNSE